MTVPEGFKGLNFPCECVSSRGGRGDPWAAVAKHRPLPNGAKEEILNLVAREPKTISQMAEAPGLSAPSVYAHVGDMLKSELLRESVEWEKTHPAERYYEPNFPVIREEEAAELCGEPAAKVAALFRRHRRQLEKALGATSLPGRGWDFAEVAQCVYARVQRGASELLEEGGTLAPPGARRNGVEWVFRAEEPEAGPET